MGPAPLAGRHRYIFTLWWQTPPGRLDEIAKEDINHTVEVCRQLCAPAFEQTIAHFDVTRSQQRSTCEFTQTDIRWHSAVLAGFSAS
jgi:hypothetical protein